MAHSASGDLPQEPRGGAGGSPSERPGAPEGAAGTPPAGTPPAAGTTTAATERPTGRRVPRTRTGAAYKALLASLLVLILLLVFILENTQQVKISYFGAGGHLPLGVALLIAAIGGALLVAIAGTARILQLRRHVKRPR